MTEVEEYPQTEEEMEKLWPTLQYLNGNHKEVPRVRKDIDPIKTHDETFDGKIKKISPLTALLLSAEGGGAGISALGLVNFVQSNIYFNEILSSGSETAQIP